MNKVRQNLILFLGFFATINCFVKSLDLKTEVKKPNEKKILNFQDLLKALKKEAKQKKESLILENFEKNIFRRFYPKANVLTKQIIPFATTDQLAKKIIPVILKTFEESPYYYFCQDIKAFSPKKLDAIISELEIYSKALESFWADPITKKISTKKTGQMEKLIKVWKQENNYDAYLNLQIVLFGFLNRKLASYTFREIPENQSIDFEFDQTKQKLLKVLQKLAKEQKCAEKVNDCAKAIQRITKKLEEKRSQLFYQQSEPL